MMSTQTSSDVSLEFALAVKNRENDFNSEDEEEINEEMALLDMSKPRYSYQNLNNPIRYLILKMITTFKFSQKIHASTNMHIFCIPSLIVGVSTL